MLAVMAACGPTPAPTMNPADAQGTAVAAAWTVVAMTQIAIPTATAMPPTQAPSPTALPTFTPLPILPTTALESFPTQPVYIAPTNPPAAGAANTDPCNRAMSSNAEGRKVKTRIMNQTDGSVVLSLYLNKTLFGECGYYSVNIEPRGSTSVELVEGVYWVGASINGKRDVNSFNISLELKAPSGSMRITENGIK